MKARVSFILGSLVFLRALAATVVHAKEEAGFREVALKSFDQVWSTINDYQFDTNFNGLDWKKVRQELRPQAEKATNNAELRVVLERMIDPLGQSHMTIIPGDLESRLSVGVGEAGVRAEYRLFKDKMIFTSVEKGSSAERAGLKAGYEILQIGKTSFAKELSSLPKKNERDRQFLAWKLTRKLLSGRDNTELTLTCLDEFNAERQLRIIREESRGEPVKIGNFPELTATFESRLAQKGGKKIGVIQFNYWVLPTALKFNKAIDEFRGADGIIIDLRGNHGGLAGMVMGSAAHFFSKQVSFGTLKMRDNQLQFLINPRAVDLQGNAAEPFAGPVAILTDEMSISASELFAAGMQFHKRAKIFGRATPGQALPAVADKLPCGDVFYHPFADFILPDGSRVEGHGVLPDVAIPINREELLEGRDPVFDAAMEWIARK